jgi:hypothetical protein
MLIIDRFEGEFAIIETSADMVNVPRIDLPSTAKEGDILEVTIKSAETDERKQQVIDKMDRLFK